MASSDYKSRIEAQVGLLVRSFIHLATGFEESDENFTIAEEYINSNLRHHKFLAVDKFRVNREIKGLQEKFAIHSQESKAQLLGDRVDKFLTRKLKPHAPDIHHNVLQFLLLLSNNPLSVSDTLVTKLQGDSFLTGSKRVDLQTQKTAELQSESLEIEDPDEESSSEDDNDSFSSEGSQLSLEDLERPLPVHTSKFNESSRSANYQNRMNEEQRSHVGDASKNERSFRSIATTNPSGFLSAIKTPNQSFWVQQPPPPSRQQKVAEHTVLNHQGIVNKSSLQKRSYEEFLSESRAIGDSQYLQVPRTFSRMDLFRDPNSLASIYEEHMKRNQGAGLLQQHWLYETKTERWLIQDVIHMLQGQASNTFVYIPDNPPRFGLARKIQVSHLSPGALENLLDFCIDFANSLLRFTYLREKHISAETFGATFEAFVAAIHTFFRDFMQVLDGIHLVFLHQTAIISRLEISQTVEGGDVVAEQRTISLIELTSEVKTYYREFTLMLTLLEGVIDIFEAKQEDMQEEKLSQTNIKSHMQAAQATRMIDFLYSRVQLRDMTRLTQNNAKLFLSCIEPYLDLLNDWLHGGLFFDRFSEFFIASKRKQGEGYHHIDDKIDWKNDFTLRNFQDDDSNRTLSLTPQFLKQHEDTILQIGKSVRLIGYVLSEETNKIGGASSQLRLGNIRNEVMQCVKEAFEKIQEATKDVLRRIAEAAATSATHSKPPPTEATNSVFQPRNVQDRPPKRLKCTSLSKLLWSQTPKTIAAISASSATAVKEYPSEESNPFHILDHSDRKAIPGSILFSLQTEAITQPSSPVNDLPMKATELPPSKSAQADVYTSEAFFSIFEQSISHVIQSLHRRVKEYLGNLFMSTFMLRDHLQSLRAVYFMEDGQLQSELLSYIFENLETAETIRNTANIKTHFNELLLSSRSLRRSADRFSIEIKHDPINTYLKNIKIAFDAPYPLDAIFDADSSFLYNHIFQFLLQLKKAHFFLVEKNYYLKKQSFSRVRQREMGRHRVSMNEEDRLRYSTMEVEEQDEEDLLLQDERVVKVKRRMCSVQRELLHFMDSFSHSTFIAVIDAQTKIFLQQLAKELNISSFILLHKEYLRTIAEACFLSKKTAHLFAVISNLFKVCTDFHTLILRLEAVETLDSRTLFSETKRIIDDLNGLSKQANAHISFLVGYISSIDDLGLKLHCKEKVAN